MNLKLLCHQLCCIKSNIIDETDPVASRIMCQEYSPLLEDVKSYPMEGNERIFALCWTFLPKGRFQATMLPWKQPFSCSCTLKPGARTQLHTHEYLELAYVVHGSFRQKISGRDVIFHKGDLCLIDKNCLHQDYFSDTPSTILFFGISNAAINDIMGCHAATERIVSFLRSSLLKHNGLQQYLHFTPRQNGDEKMDAVISTLLQELAQYDQGSFYICFGLLLRVFSLLSSEYDFLLSREVRREKDWPLFEEITSYMEGHLNNISIQKMVRHFHFQDDYFNRLLKAKTGMTYTEYLQNMRLEKAEFLLKNTDLTIDQITEAVGYHNKGYFYKIFSERHQTTPAKFRKRLL